MTLDYIVAVKWSKNAGGVVLTLRDARAIAGLAERRVEGSYLHSETTLQRILVLWHERYDHHLLSLPRCPLP